jgi:hypothetical protein
VAYLTITALGSEIRYSFDNVRVIRSIVRYVCNLFEMFCKGGSKPKTECDAYRGISLISCVCKVFEKLLDCRIDERLNNFPNTQQMAYQKYLNSMFASFPTGYYLVVYLCLNRNISKFDCYNEHNFLNWKHILSSKFHILPIIPRS